MKKEHLNWLKENNACRDSIEWIEENNIQTLEDAWSTCERGDWLLWLASKLGVDKRKLTLCGALCAHTVVQYMEDPRSRNAIRVAFLFGRGKATEEELEKARIDANAAMDWRPTPAARAANASWFSVAAYFANIAAATADADTDRKANQRQTAEIARKVLTNEVLQKIKELR